MSFLTIVVAFALGLAIGEVGTVRVVSWLADRIEDHAFEDDEPKDEDDTEGDDES